MRGRVVRFAAAGAPLSVLEVAEEEIATPGPGEVLVKVRCRPINPSDLLFVAGKYARPPHLPSYVGYEGAGTILAAGPGVDLAVGTHCIVDTLGTWRDFVVTHVSNIIPTPDDLDLELASMAVINPVSAFLMLDSLGLLRGQWLLQTAAASAVGQCLLALARQSGLRLISVVRRPEHRELLIRLGAEHVIDTSVEDLPPEVFRITQGTGVQAVLDPVGGTLGSLAFSCLARGGALLSYGMLSGEPLTIPPEPLIFQGQTIRGFWLPAELDRVGQTAGERALQYVLASLRRGDLCPAIEARYDLADVRAALEHAERSGRFGKVLLVSPP